MSKYCDSIAASSPYTHPSPSPAERRRASVAERGLSVAPCPHCGRDSEVEPPCAVTRDGQRLTATIVRCIDCGVTRTEEPDLQAEEAREETSMPDTPCPCGCGKPIKVGGKFAGRGCSLRAFHSAANPDRAVKSNTPLRKLEDAKRALRAIPRHLRSDLIVLVAAEEDCLAGLAGLEHSDE